MPKGKLFEYAILYHPKEKKDAAGNPTESKASVVVKAPTTLVAVKEEQVAILAAREIPQEYLDKLEDVEILIRPFAA